MDRPFAAYTGDQPYIFVCYAHDDEDIVYPEIAQLNEQGIHLWYDEGISAGRVWRAELAEAIEASSKILFYVSKSSLASNHCGREINLAYFERFPWFQNTVHLTPELREHPLILKVNDALGFTKAWRLELCKRASTLPPESHITCDPSKYSLTDS